MISKDSVVLLSGGLDSTTVLAIAIREIGTQSVLALSFNYGQRHGERELNAAKAVTDYYRVQHNIIDLTSLNRLLQGSALTDPTIDVPDGHYESETMKITVVPNRNAIMLSIAFGAARAAGAHFVYAGMHAGDHAIYPDCRQEFLKAFESCIELANADLDWAPTLETPFIEYNKADIVKRGVLLDVPYELTYSCYKGQVVHCGTCGTCTERKEAFERAGVKDPTMYALNMTNA